MSALKLTLEIALIAVPLNTIFGIIIAIMLVRHNVPGKSLINAVLALPFALSPVVVGLCLILAYGQTGWFGAELANAGIDVIFSMPGMVLATMFVSLPFVAREVMPVLREIGTEQEQAAATLGAGQWTTFRRITLPAIRWGVIYGVILTTARCHRRVRRRRGGLGQRHRPDRDDAALRRSALYEGFDKQGAYAARSCWR